MSKLREMLNDAVELFGVNDIVTIMLSNKIDKEIAEQQKGIYEEWQLNQAN